MTEAKLFTRKYWAIISIFGAMVSSPTLHAQTFPVPPRGEKWGDRRSRPRDEYERTLVSFDLPKRMKINLLKGHPTDLFRSIPKRIDETHELRRVARFSSIRGGSLWVPPSLEDEIVRDRVLKQLGLKTGPPEHIMIVDPDYRDFFSLIPNCGCIETSSQLSFVQGSAYELNLAEMDGHESHEAYVVLEAMKQDNWVKEFMGDAALRLEITDEDFNNVVSGKSVVKVVYLPDRLSRDNAGNDVKLLTSTNRPDSDTVERAKRHGTVLLVVRMGFGKLFSLST